MTVKEQALSLIEREWSLLRQRYGVRRIGIFGSCTRGEDRPDSDVDILVEFERKTFDNYMGLKFFLEDHLDRRVDLVIADSIKPRLREAILQEVEYAAGAASIR
jgi:predicted nucleotidyltransferase